MESGYVREWIQAYLREPAWENRRMAAIVHGQQPNWEGPVEVEIDKLHRIAGPGSTYRYPQDPEQWSIQVEAITKSLKSPLDLPPILVRPQPDLIHVSDGNHRLDGLRSLGYSKVWALLWHDRHPGCTGTWSPFAPESPPVLGQAKDIQAASSFRQAHIGPEIPNATYVCAEIDGRIIGLVTLVEHEDCHHLNSIFVLPEYRNRFLGTRLLMQLKELDVPIRCSRASRMERLLIDAGFRQIEAGYELNPC